MKSKKKWAIGLIISFLISGCLWILAFVGPKLDRGIKESDIVELKGNFKKIEEEEDHYLISLQDMPLQLFIGKQEIIDLESLTNLSEGTMIYFGVSNVVADNINELDMVRVITLRSETENMVTLESYRKADRRIVEKMKTGCIIGGIIFLGTGIICFIKMMTVTKRQSTSL